MMQSLYELARDNSIQVEYEKALLLFSFRKLCKQYDRDEKYKNRIMKLYRESYNYTETTKIIMRKEYGLELDDKMSQTMSKWIMAHIKKKASRDSIPNEVKKKLYDKQGGLCASCGVTLGVNWSKIHVDHIIPWDLVGDELADNLQNLCSTCNEEKGDNTNYIFLKKIGLK